MAIASRMETIAVDKRTDSPEAPVIPEEFQAKAKSLIGQAFGLFADHFKSLTEDIANYHKKRREVQERIDRGARQTDGEIV